MSPARRAASRNPFDTTGHIMRGRSLFTLAVLLATATLTGSQTARPSSLENVLQVTLLGTGNPRPNMERFGAATLVEAGSRRILIDAGRGAAQRLWDIGQRTTLISVDAVFFTHLHSDHIVGLPDVWLTSGVFGRSTPLQLFGPPGTAEMAGHLEKAYEWDITTRTNDEGFPVAARTLPAKNIQPGVVYDRDGLKVTAFMVDHGPPKPAYGYRVDYRGRSVAFSGDTKYFEPIADHAKGVDVLVHEVVSPEVETRRAQTPDPEGVKRIIEHHTTPEQAGQIFTKVKPRLAVFSHIVPTPTTAEDLIGPTRKTYSGPLVVGYDLMTIVIGDTLEVFPHRVLSDK
jgi:ribonuclease Z